MKASTPFLDYIQREYMWKLTPPITSPTELAEKIGIRNRQVASNWFHGTMPSAEMCIIISNATGLPLHDLLRVCSIPIPEYMCDPRIIRDYLLHEMGTRTSIEVHEVIRLFDEAVARQAK